MEKLKNLIKKLKKFEKDLFMIIEQVIKDNEDIVVEMNSESQLFDRGIDRDGVAIESYMPYSPITVELKREKGQPTSRVTLRDEGDFHYSFFIDFKSDGFEIRATDWKYGDLIDKYGEKILGLTDENLNDLVQNYIKPVLIQKFREL